LRKPCADDIIPEPPLCPEWNAKAARRIGAKM
jgi:hypothetical protein